MYEHDFTAEEPLGAADGLSSYEIQEIEQEAQEYGLTPTEVVELEEQELTMNSLPPAEAEEYEQEIVSQEDQQAEDTMQQTMDQAESFDQTLVDG